MRVVSVLVVVFAIVVVPGLLLWRQHDDALVLTPLQTEVRTVPAADDDAAAGAPEPDGLRDVHTAGTSPDAESGSVGADQPSDWPDHVESLIYDYLSKLSNDIASINVVKCDDTTCNVSFYASDASEASRARLARIPTEFTRAPINAGSIGYAVREPSPGLLEVQITLYGRSVKFSL